MMFLDHQAESEDVQAETRSKQKNCVQAVAFDVKCEPHQAVARCLLCCSSGASRASSGFFGQARRKTLARLPRESLASLLL